MRKLEKFWHLTPLKKAFMGGSIFYGFLIGALISGKLMDNKGRKFTFVLGSMIFFFFGFTSSFANDFTSFIIYRIGVGFGIGFIIPTAQAFITELSPLKYRGFCSVIIWLGFPLGEIYICVIAKAFPLDDKVLHNSNWTILMLLAGFPVNFLLI
jgi:MFS family permease